MDPRPDGPRGDRRSLALVSRFWREHKLWAALLLVGSALVTAIGLVFPYILRFIIDGIREGMSEARLLWLVMLLLAFGLLRALGEVVLPYNRARTNERFQWLTRTRVFRRVLDMGYSLTNRFPTGDVMERLDHDLGELSWFVCSAVFRCIVAVFTVLFAVGVMLSMNPFLTAITVLPIGAGVVIWMKLGPLVYRRYRRWRELISAINNRIESAFSGVRLVKGYNMEERIAAGFRAKLDERVGAAVETIRAEARIDVFYMVISEVGVLVVLWVGGLLVVGDRLTLGEFVAFNSYVMMLVGPMFDIGNVFVSGRRAQAGSERVEEVERHRPEVSRPETGVVPPENGDLELSEVDFAYERKLVLKGVSMKFPAGARVGVAGTVGSGKSSIFALLFRLADPRSGTVRYAGQDIREYDLDKYRRVFGYAPQEPMLFSDTVRNNIDFGREAGEDELKRVVGLAEFESDLAEMTKGPDEMLGERGTRLSGGQKERVAIARALVGRPRVLVFDDATSALDAETERELTEHLTGELGGTTVIIVSHRLSVLAGCDHVYVLDSGEVKEEGTHDELLRREGLYWQLYERQLMKEEIDGM
ncbi:MAG: ABC transporter ATP-binding protein [candidate division WOR-3 bacterium]|nr:MAG: ABC transporter ATP-binding protein [candidate division WOR-3 bacterium]